MRYTTAVNQRRGRVLGSRIALADGWWLRARGLLGRGGLAGGEGMLLRPCRAVHTIGMAFPLDIVFLDRAGNAVALYSRLAPNRRTGWHRAAVEALELPAGTLDATGTAPGDLIVCGAVEPA